MDEVTLHLRVIDPNERFDRRLSGVLDVPLAEALTRELSIALSDGRRLTVLIREDVEASSTILRTVL
jgi:hypothetical protein